MLSNVCPVTGQMWMKWINSITHVG